MNGKLRRFLLIFGLFFKISCFTFGGAWSIVAQLEEEFSRRRHWLTEEQLLDIATLARSLPGIMMANVGVLFGIHMGSGWYCVAAIAGLMLPPLLIFGAITAFYQAFMASQVIARALTGIRAALVPVIGVSALGMCRQVMKSPRQKLILLAAILAVFLLKADRLLLIALGAVTGPVLFRGKKDETP